MHMYSRWAKWMKREEAESKIRWSVQIKKDLRRKSREKTKMKIEDEVSAKDEKMEIRRG